MYVLVGGKGSWWERDLVAREELLVVGILSL
jgi:hypothetical protein